MWVRTSDAYVAIDPATNTVTTTLTKADVGPEANRSWAVDGALWICDGSRLHRYDPTNVSLVTTVELGIDCGQVCATSDLGGRVDVQRGRRRVGSFRRRIHRSGDEHRRGKGRPARRRQRAGRDGRRRLLPRYGNAGAASVDRQSWTVTEHELDVPLGGSQPTTDGTFIYVPTADKHGIVVIDARSHQVVDKIEPLERQLTRGDRRRPVGGRQLVRLPPALRPRHLTGSARSWPNGSAGVLTPASPSAERPTPFATPSSPRPSTPPSRT